MGLPPPGAGVVVQGVGVPVGWVCDMWTGAYSRGAAPSTLYTRRAL